MQLTSLLLAVLAIACCAAEEADETSDGTRAKCCCPPGYTGNRCQTAIHDCMEHFLAGSRESGVYTIIIGDSFNERAIRVYCEMTKHNGWTAMKLYITSRSIAGHANRIRFDLVSNVKGSRYAEYSRFSVDSEETNYKLNVGGYSGNAGDSFDFSAIQFSTIERDNDQAPSDNCAKLYPGGWWYAACFNGKLTGLYGQGHGYARGIVWRTFLGYYDFLDYAVMKITYDV